MLDNDDLSASSADTTTDTTANTSADTGGHTGGSDNGGASAGASNPTDNQPSSGTPEKTEVSDRDGLLAVVRDAVAPKDPNAAPAQGTSGAQPGTAAPGTTASSTDGQPGDPAKAPNPLDSDPSEAELKALRPQTRKRIESLLGQRNEARSALEAVRPQLDAHKQLTGYLQEHKLAPDDVNMLLGVGAALRRGDYAAFLKGVSPYVQLCQEALGQTIAPNLQAQVNDGQLSEDAAKELTRTRMAAARSQVEADQSRQQIAARDQSDAARQVQAEIGQWEQGIRSRDPDYSLKEKLVRNTSVAIIAAEGQPRTAQDAIKIAQRAYDEVSATFRRAAPAAPQPTRQAPSSLSSSPNNARPEPRNMREAIQQGLDRSARGMS